MAARVDVLLQRIAQLVVVHQLAGCLHGAQQGRLGVGTGRLCPLLVQFGEVRSAFSPGEGRQCALFVRVPVAVVALVTVVGGGSEGVLAEDDAPSLVKNLLARYLELDAVRLSEHGGGGKLAVRIEHRDEAACHEVEHTAFHVRQVCWRNMAWWSVTLELSNTFFDLLSFCPSSGAVSTW